METGSLAANGRSKRTKIKIFQHIFSVGMDLVYSILGLHSHFQITDPSSRHRIPGLYSLIQILGLYFPVPNSVRMRI